MNEIKTFPPGILGSYDYVVMLSRYQGKIMLSRHKQRMTWELQGGHIEPGETPEQAAKRELFEESGAVSFELIPLCDYCGEEPGKHNFGRGMVFRLMPNTIRLVAPAAWAVPRPSGVNSIENIAV